MQPAGVHLSRNCGRRQVSAHRGDPRFCDILFYSDIVCDREMHGLLLGVPIEQESSVVLRFDSHVPGAGHNRKL